MTHLIAIAFWVLTISVAVVAIWTTIEEAN